MEDVLRGVNEWGQKQAWMVKISDSLGVKPAIIVAGFFSLVCPFLLFGVGSTWLSTIIGGIWPAMETHKV